MNETSQYSPLSEDLDLAERYLLQAMFKEAESLSSSILRRCCFDREKFENGIVESASMVLLQSLNEHGKADEIFNKLELLFESVAVIPADVLILGAHLQITPADFLRLCATLTLRFQGVKMQIYLKRSVKN